LLGDDPDGWDDPDDLDDPDSWDDPDDSDDPYGRDDSDDSDSDDSIGMIQMTRTRMITIGMIPMAGMIPIGMIQMTRFL
ncbi:hypothetical protein Dimus_037614, partial [Dionaea muscipula]